MLGLANMHPCARASTSHSSRIPDPPTNRRLPPWSWRARGWRPVLRSLVDERAASLGRVPLPPGGGIQPVAQLRVVVRVLRQWPQMEPAEERAGPLLDSCPEPVPTSVVVCEPCRQVFVADLVPRRRPAPVYPLVEGDSGGPLFLDNASSVSARGMDIAVAGTISCGSLGLSFRAASEYPRC